MKNQFKEEKYEVMRVLEMNQNRILGNQAEVNRSLLSSALNSQRYDGAFLDFLLDTFADIVREEG